MRPKKDVSPYDVTRGEIIFRVLFGIYLVVIITLWVCSG